MSIKVFEGDVVYDFDTLHQFLLFKQSYLWIDAAGGIVEDGLSNILLIKRLGYWDFPKGKVEAGETFEESAIREVEEETSIHNITIVKSLGESYHIYKLNGSSILKCTHWYLMKSEGIQALQPQIEEQISEVKWVQKRDINQYLVDSYPSLQDLWERISDK